MFYITKKEFATPITSIYYGKFLVLMYHANLQEYVQIHALRYKA